jgi:hypothetical protein
MSADEDVVLHAVARDLLAEFRELDDMPADARARVRRRLEAEDDAPARAVQGRDARSWIVWSLVGAAAAAVLLLGVNALVPAVQEREQGTPAEAAPDRVESEGATGRVDVRSERAESKDGAVEAVTRTVEPVAVAPTSAPAKVVARKDRRVRDTTPPEIAAPPVTSEPAVEAKPSSTLEAERRLIAQAWNALAQGDPAAALASADTHRERFANGILAPERAAVEAIARCKRDGDDARARAFLKAHSRSPLAARVRSACAL